MAEIAIPMAVLGGMYILSNQKDKSISNTDRVIIKREGFEPNNTTIPKNVTKQLPNSNTPAVNYPVNGMAEMKHSPNYYPSPNAATDKYFHQSVYEAKAEADPNKYKSLTGNTVSAADLKHNNMVPFFGSKVRQTNDYKSNEYRLDNMNGTGSQHFKKQEIAPMFNPEENVQWSHGTPNRSDFFQSRQNPSMSMANVKPFQEIRVGPGLNQKDGVLGSGGFNSGMQARERWMAKTVDELRAKNNPKVTYGGVILGGKDRVTNRGIMGKMEKHQPDTYYINGPERYFTTGGLEKGQTARSIQILPDENRTTTTREYFGTGDQTTGEATYVPGSYLPAKRPELDPNIKHVTNGYAPNRQLASNGEYGINGYKDSVLQNNRSLTSERPPEYGAVSTFAKAVIAPLLDMLRPTRKENVIGNLRPVGNAGNVAEHHAGYVYNPANRPKTTIREMTENRPDHMFVNNQKESGGYGYIVSDQQVKDQQRDTTTCHYVGNSGNTNTTGNIMTYDSAYNAQLIDKEPISRGRVPTKQGVKMFNGQSHTNIKVDKIETDRNNNRLFVPQNITKATPAKQQFGLMNARSEYGQGIHCQRNAPETLNAFRSNPYAHSLSSVA
jgi:hypothetical protein